MMVSYVGMVLIFWGIRSRRKILVRLLVKGIMYTIGNNFRYSLLFGW